MPSPLGSVWKTLQVLLIAGLFSWATPSAAITTTYEGVTVEWNAWFSDIRPNPSNPQIGDNFYYETEMLSPYGDGLPIRITLPAQFTQSAVSKLTLYSEAGGSYPYRIVKEVTQIPGGPVLADLVLDAYTTVNISMPQDKGHAFVFQVSASTGNSEEGTVRLVSFAVHLSAAPNKGVSKNPEGKGPPEGPPDPPPEPGEPPPPPSPPPSCPIGFPTHTVNLANLNLLVRDTEFSVQSLGPGLVTTRTWNADPTRAGMFGNGWNFAFESTLQRFCGGAQITSGSGKGLVYSAGLCLSSGSLSYPVTAVAPEGIFDTLSYLSEDYWLLIKKDSGLTYRYDPASPGSDRYRLSAIIDQNDNALAILYNADGSIMSVKDAVGRQLGFTYDSLQRASSIATPDGGQVSFAYDARGNLVRSVDLFGTEVLYQYDADNLMTAMSYAGKTISYTYDNSGGWKHLASVTDANGAVTSYTGDTGSSKTTETDARGGSTTITTNSAGKLNSVLDPLGNLTSMSYTQGLLTSVTDPKYNVVARAYDSRGNLTKFTDASAKLTTYGYDARDNQVSQTSALGETWTYGYDNKKNLTRITSPGNKVQTFAYDSKGQLLSVTDANGNSTRFSYDKFGNRLAKIDALGKQTTYGYDSAGINRSSALDPNGNASTFAYDQNRRLTRITHADGSYRSFRYDGCARTGFSDENGNSSSYSRDKMLRITSITDALNAVTSNRYDAAGNLVAMTDALQQTSAVSYDAANRLASITDPISGNVLVTHDANGNVIALRDELLEQTLIAYDENNRVRSSSDPLGRVVNLTRDERGRLTQKQNARGAHIGFAYDADGQLSTKSYDAATSATYAYDNAGNLNVFTDAGGTTRYTYNGRDEVSAIAYPDGKTVSFAYDAAGNLASINYPGGLALTYGVSSRNRIQTMQWDTHQVSFGHDAVGNLLSETRSNGSNSEYQYDAANRLSTIRHQKGVSAIASMNYTRNALGDVTSESGELPVASSPIDRNDAGVYDAANQISTLGGSSYSYDADGNLTGISGSRTFASSYDPENRPLQMTGDVVTASYRYDALGNRVQAVRAAQTNKYYHDHLGRLLFEADGSGNVVSHYLYRGSRLVAMRSAAGASYFYHHDKTGNTVIITNASGDTANAYAYTPYGEVTASTETVANRFKYVGAYGVMAEGGGIYFMKNRYYDAVNGRFLQKDPIGFGGGQTNLYAYVENNPVDQTDPSGLIVVGPLALVGAGAAIAFPFVDPQKSTREEQQRARWRRMQDAMDSVSSIDGDSSHNYGDCSRTRRPTNWI